MWLSLLADVLSVIGFGVTVFVAFRVNAIRKQYQLMGRVPAQTNELFNKTERLTELWNAPSDNREQIVAVLGAIEVSLRSLERFLDGDLKRMAKDLKGDARQLQGLSRRVGLLRRSPLRSIGEPELTHGELRRLYNELNKLVASVEEEIENQNWVR